MDRRGFMTQGSKLLAGLTLAGWSGIHPGRLSASEPSPFSIDVVTRHPELAIPKIEHAIRASGLRQQNIGFLEYELKGPHVGDIVFAKGHRLVNFYEAADPFSQRLKEVASALSLPQTCHNPTLLRFYSAEGGTRPAHAQVLCGNVFLMQLPLHCTKEVHRFEGAPGHIEVAAGDGSVQIVSASCKHKTCMNMGAIYRAGQSLVCIPAQLSVSIAGANKWGVDGVTS